MTKEERKQYMRAYYEANKDRLRERSREYYHSIPKSYWKKYNRARYEQHQKDRIERSRNLRERNQRLYGEEQAIIRKARKAAGMTMEEVAKRVGKGITTVYEYERGLLKARWEELEEAIPGLKEERKKWKNSRYMY